MLLRALFRKARLYPLYNERLLVLRRHHLLTSSVSNTIETW